MTAPKEIIKLVDLFERNIEEYKSGKYNEAQVRIQFVDPFFEALGWDINNKQGYSPAYCDVIHEDSIAVGSMTKAPDYCFRVGKERKFFVEAKKPSVNIKEDISPAFQVRRYAWSAKLPLSILTDFEEFSVYDCRIKPRKGDRATVARIKYINYKEYLSRWDEISEIFSRDAVLKGSFDKYAESTRKKKGTAEIDDVFLEDIESWRKELAKNLAINNMSLTQRQLNYAVQKIIDRIIFLRICEDRKIENSLQLMALLNGNQTYAKLCQIFRKADDKYNSGLFHFNKNDDVSEQVDEFTLSLKIDDHTLKDIIKKLYYPESPYEFSYIPADILGQVYEQFLGKVIRLTSTHTAEIEEKPEVRKAGGVYYTPTYIVDYIVKNTVGKIVEDKKPDQVSKIKILDPACGSGSFLISAYQFLIDWHRDWYIKNEPEKWAKKKQPPIYQNAIGEWVLSINEKKRILLNNIFGVDIDNQAVEVTKLSLLLKVLEGETDPSLNTQLSMFQERVLPNLGNNIKCGNSLIGTDYYDGQLKLPGEEETYKVNAFDWDKAFPEIFRADGFDVVIGNPPYIDSELMAKEYPKSRQYLANNFYTAKGNWDLFIPFFEIGFKLLNKNGELSLITPNKWITAPYAEKLRELLYKNIYKITDCRNIKVFEAGNNPLIAFIKKNGLNANIIKEAFLENKTAVYESIICRDVLNINDWGILLAKDINLISKIKNTKNKLSAFCSVKNPFSVSEAYELKKYLIDANNKNTADHFMFINTGTIDRYISLWGTKATTYIKDKYVHPMVSKSLFNRHFPKRYIQSSASKIIISGMRYFEAFYDKRGEYIAGKSTTIIENTKGATFEALLAILNSKLITFYLKQLYSSSGIDGGINFTSSMIENIPIPDISKSTQKELIAHTQKLINIIKKQKTTKTPYEKDLLQHRIDLIDSNINKVVYKIYKLTEDEIKVVEGAV